MLHIKELRRKFSLNTKYAELAIKSNIASKRRYVGAIVITDFHRFVYNRQRDQSKNFQVSHKKCRVR
jgi:hypothetical protein